MQDENEALLSAALTGGDLESALTASHTLKGVCGNLSMTALFDLVRQAGAEAVGAGIVIEKGFQGGGDRLRAEGRRIESLAIIDEMAPGSIRFR